MNRVMKSGKKEIVKKILYQHTLAVISTFDVKTKKPEAALIAFAETKDLEIIFQTQYATRKYVNLQKNKHVALVIGWDVKHHATLQYEGVARELKSNELEQNRRLFLEKKKSPCTKEFLYHPKAKFFKIKPKWIAYSDYTKNVPKILELNF